MAIVTYEDYKSFTDVPLPETDFGIEARRAQDLLEALCRCSFPDSDEACKRAVLYQIEYIQSLGGVSEWQRVSGAVASRSYSIGGESESIAFLHSDSIGDDCRFNGLNVSSMAWGILVNAGYLRIVRGVRTCY